MAFLLSSTGISGALTTVEREIDSVGTLACTNPASSPVRPAASLGWTGQGGNCSSPSWITMISAGHYVAAVPRQRPCWQLEFGMKDTWPAKAVPSAHCMLAPVGTDEGTEE